MKTLLQESTKTTTPSGSERQAAPYRALGYDHGRYLFELPGGQQVILRPDDLDPEAFAPLEYWRDRFPKVWDFATAAEDALIRECQAAGPVNLPPEDAEVIHFEQWTPPPQIDRRPPPTLSPACSTIAYRLFEEPPTRPMLGTIDGAPFLPAGVVAAIGSAGGVGKSTFIAHIADAASKGGSFGPIHFPRPLNVLVIALEDDQSEVDRKF